MRTWILLLAFISLLACSEKVSGRGGADETSNGVTAQILSSEGTPLASAFVLVRPANFVSNPLLASHNPLKGIQNLITDEDGYFHVDTLPPGKYMLEARSDSQGIALYLEVGSAKPLSQLLQKPLIVQKYAQVHGKIELPPDAAYARLYLLGIDRTILTDSDGNFSMDDVPAGTMVLLAYMPDTTAVLGRTELTITPDTTMQLGTIEVTESEVAEWIHGASVVLNTTTSGYLLSSTLKKYSLPVHLSGANFPDDASMEGADLRVVDTKGNPLPFAITFWDTKQNEATLWILFDSIPANDSLVVAEFLWGRPGTISASDPKTVFDSANGWSAVAPLQTSFLDSAGCAFTPVFSHSTGDGVSISTDGILPDYSSQGAWFDGLGQGVGIANLALDFGSSDYTVEVWLRPEAEGGIWLSRDNKSGGKWDYGERAFYLGEKSGSVNDASGLYPIQVTHGAQFNNYAIADTAVTLNQWVHLAVRRTTISTDSALVQWFMNGSLMNTLNDRMVDNSDDLNDTLYIATPMFNRSYQGWVRQLQISHTARNPAWIAFDAAIQNRVNTITKIINRY